MIYRIAFSIEFGYIVNNTTKYYLYIITINNRLKLSVWVWLWVWVWVCACAGVCVPRPSHYIIPITKNPDQDPAAGKEAPAHGCKTNRNKRVLSTI